MEILYSDDRVVVCVKPAGVLSTDEPDGMPERLRQALGEGTVIKSVHRLDRVVGGVMVYARTRRAAADLEAQMGRGEFRKGYLAVTEGAPSPSSGTLRDMLLRDTGARRTLIVPAGTSGAREAVLDYTVLRERAGRALVAVRLHTGRTHQIRCQLAGHGTPIRGDAKYGASVSGGAIALWSYKLGFIHPRTGEAMSFMRIPPDEEPWNGLLSGIHLN